MIFQLALLLLGPSRFKYEWKWLFALGVGMIAVGAYMVHDASDKQSIFLIDMLGWVLLAIGLVEIIQSVVAQWDHSTPFNLSWAVTLTAIGSVVVFDPVTASHLDSLILGFVFILLGLFKIFFSIVAKYPHWKFILMNGIVNTVMGSLFFVEWGRHESWMIPLLFGAAVILMGCSSISNALMLRKSRFLVEGAGEEIGALDYFLRHHVGPRYRPIFSRLPSFVTVIDKLKKTIGQKRETPSQLYLHVWMPIESAENPVKPDAAIPVLSKYVVVQDQKGCLSIGHSAVRLSPDLYISHYQKEWYRKVKNFEHDEPEDFSFFERAKARDEEGVFFESYEEESKYWMPSTHIVKLDKFNEDYLRIFGNYYKMDPTYNLAVRNCSVSAVMAIDMALLGCLRGRHMILRFLRLILDKDLWIAAFLRKRAEDMVWSPGLVHDYVQALNRVIQRFSGQG